MESSQTMSSSSTQVRVVSSTSHSYQSQPMLVGDSTSEISGQFSMKGDPNSQQRIIPIQYDGPQQQDVLQQQLRQQQQLFHQVSSSFNQQPPFVTQEVQIPIQHEANTHIPKPVKPNDPSAYNAGGQGIAYGLASVGMQPHQATANISESSLQNQPGIVSQSSTPILSSVNSEDPLQFVSGQVSSGATEWPPQVKLL